jgi:hypothetical protein
MHIHIDSCDTLKNILSANQLFSLIDMKRKFVIKLVIWHADVFPSALRFFLSMNLPFFLLQALL